jgi:hypothetical protein
MIFTIFWTFVIVAMICKKLTESTYEYTIRTSGYRGPGYYLKTVMHGNYGFQERVYIQPIAVNRTLRILGSL